jgi:hypothetical protein
MTDQDIQDLVENYFPEEGTLTPYKIIKILNTMLEEDLPTQMGYNYRNKSFGFKAIQNEEGKWVVTAEEAKRFAASFVAKKVARLVAA